MKKRLLEEQVVSSLREVEADIPVKRELCRKHGLNEALREK